MKKKLTIIAFIITSLFVIAGMSVIVSNFKKGDFSGGLIGIFLVVGISFLDYKLWEAIHINQPNIVSSNHSWFKRINFPIVLAVLLVLGLLDGNNKRKEESSSQTSQNNETENDKKEEEEKQLPTCDGVSITSNCVVDGITYSKYIYHPAKEAVTHIEKVQTGTETTTSDPYILCKDGFHWGSKTRKGACSGHNGVADPEHVDVIEKPVYEEQIVEDSPAQDEYYEKEEKQKE